MILGWSHGVGRWILILTLLAPGAALGQIARIPAADSSAGGFFGGAVAIDGDRLLIGATGHATCGPNSGAAYVYDLENGQWRQAARLDAEDCEPEEYLGRAVALEGDVAVVSAFVPTPFAARSNAVYVFERGREGTWQQTARLTDPNPAEDGPFAAAVAVDGGRILVTSSGDTAAGRFGGTATVFERAADGRWVPRARFSPPHDARLGVFGTSAALDGSRAVVTASTYSANRPGSAHIFQERDGEWVHQSRIDGLDDYFLPVDMEAGRLVVGQTREGDDHTGRAVVYELRDGNWQRDAELKPNAPYPGGGFGSDVALSGDLAAVVGFDEQLKLEFNIDRVVFVFRRTESGTWEQHRLIDVGQVYFGAAIGMDGDRVVIGQASEEEPGAVYVATVR